MRIKIISTGVNVCLYAAMSVCVCKCYTFFELSWSGFCALTVRNPPDFFNAHLVCRLLTDLASWRCTRTSPSKRTPRALCMVSHRTRRRFSRCCRIVLNNFQPQTDLTDSSLSSSVAPNACGQQNVNSTGPALARDCRSLTFPSFREAFVSVTVKSLLLCVVWCLTVFRPVIWCVATNTVRRITRTYLCRASAWSLNACSFIFSRSKWWSHS